MRIDHRLKINGETAERINHMVRLEVTTPGRGIITAKLNSVPAVGQGVELESVLNDSGWRPLLWGFIERVSQINNDVWQLAVRELSALANRRTPLNLRHCLPADVLAEIGTQTGLTFVLPDQPWTKQQMPRFQHIGGGYGALDNILRVWQVTSGIWSQQPDGRVYIGERAQSLQGSKTIKLDPAIFSGLTATGGTIPLLPILRPGASIQVGEGSTQVLHSIDITDDKMRLQWQPTLSSSYIRAIA